MLSVPICAAHRLRRLSKVREREAKSISGAKKLLRQTMFKQSRANKLEFVAEPGRPDRQTDAANTCGRKLKICIIRRFEG